MTRVFHLRNSDRFGGPERLILDQVLCASDGVEHVVASFGEAEAPHPFLDPVREAGVATCLIPQSNSYDPRSPARARSAIRQLAPDVVVGHDYKANMVLALGASQPRVAVIHGYTAEDSKVRFFEAIDRRVVRTAGAIVVVSDLLRDQLVQGGAAPKQVHVIPNGVNADRVAAAAHGGREAVRREWALADDVSVILVLGRLSPEKGQDVAMDAFAALQRTDTRLVLVGDGASHAALVAQASTLGIARRVRFAGWRTDPWPCLGAADVFLLPSRTEGLPVALLEAMASSVPVVATDVGSVAEVLESGASGLVIPPDDAVEAANALRAVLEDADAARGRTRHATRRVRDAYSVAAQARRLEDVYRSAVP